MRNPTLLQDGYVIGNDPEVSQVLLVDDGVDVVAVKAEPQTKFGNQAASFFVCRCGRRPKQHGEKMIDARNARAAVRPKFLDDFGEPGTHDTAQTINALPINLGRQWLKTIQ